MGDKGTRFIRMIGALQTLDFNPAEEFAYDFPMQI